MKKQPEERTSHSTTANARFESLKEWILERPNVSETDHKFGGTEFQLKGLEFMHNHGPRFLDIRLSKGDQSRVLKEGKARRHRASVHHHAGWVSFRLERDEDLDGAKELIGLAYGNAKKGEGPVSRRNRSGNSRAAWDGDWPYLKTLRE